MYGDLADEPGDLFSGVLDLAEEEEDKIKQEYNTHINQEICTTLESEELTEQIEWLRKHRENQESWSNTEKHEKVESIEPLTSRDIECHEEYDESWDDEEYLEEIHNETKTKIKDEGFGFLLYIYRVPVVLSFSVGESLGFWFDQYQKGSSPRMTETKGILKMRQQRRTFFTFYPKVKGNGLWYNTKETSHFPS